MDSGCQICATTGQCSLAFHNGPGQYCGQWYDQSTDTNKPCCCPLLQVGMQTTCNMTPTQCKCHVYGSQGNHPTQYVNNYKNWGENPSSLPPWVHGVVPIIFVILCCLTCCRFPKRHGHNSHHHHQQHGVPIARAVQVDESCPPPPENPAYYGSTSHHHHQHHDNSGSGNAVAVASGLGGFAIGTILGDLIGRNNAGGGHHRIGGDDDLRTPYVGGGYDIIGDSGGYDIQGDTGGYDIQGDS